jgi:squalene-associated FAD-dependent desaturase
MPSSLRVAVVGGGWAGLAAAVAATRAGHHVTLYEMAPQLGGRARRVDVEGSALDNGQHILIGAYANTLALMAELGIDANAVLLRMPLRVTYADGSGLRLPPGSPVPAFFRGVLSYRGWRWRDKFALLRAAAGWRLRGFQCASALTVAELTAHLPKRVCVDLIDPLCVAALNTPAVQASAQVFLRVLKDALFSGPGSADLLLPRVRLSELLPNPAERWLARHGAVVRLTHRVESLARLPSGWSIDGEPADAVVLACTASEAARLAESHNPAWSLRARALAYEPIITVYTRSPGTRLSAPMLALRASAEQPAQFVFDLGQLGGPADTLAFVISGAARCVEQGSDATVQAILAQARTELGEHIAASSTLLKVITEKRATFLCTPRLQRPPADIAPGLVAAGDYVNGPYPATLEGAVRSGLHAATRLIPT